MLRNSYNLQVFTTLFIIIWKYSKLYANFPKVSKRVVYEIILVILPYQHGFLPGRLTQFVSTALEPGGQVDVF